MIPFFDPRAAYLAQKDAIDAAIGRVLSSGRVILGAEVEAFEGEFAAMVGAAYGIGTASGTDAIELALRACGVGAGDEVITVANAGVPTVAAIRHLGAVPRFVDVEPDTLLMNPALLPMAITDRSRAIVPVHLFGQAAPMDEILTIARAHQLVVVEDCAHAHGTLYRGRHVGRMGDVGCFSFYPTKNLGAFGDGGLAVTERVEVAEQLRRMRTYGLIGDSAQCEGINSRLDEIQAAILRVKLTAFAKSILARRSLAAFYDERLTGIPGLARIPLAAHSEPAYHLYVVRSDDRRRFSDRLDRAGIGWRIHYPKPVHLMDAYRQYGGGAGNLPSTERSCDEILSLPFYPELEAADAERVVEALLGSS